MSLECLKCLTEHFLIGRRGGGYRARGSLSARGMLRRDSGSLQVLVVVPINVVRSRSQTGTVAGSLRDWACVLAAGRNMQRAGLPGLPGGLRDSKWLRTGDTEEAFLQLAEAAVGWAVVQAQQLVGLQDQAGLGRPSHQQLRSPVDGGIVRCDGVRGLLVQGLGLGDAGARWYEPACPFARKRRPAALCQQRAAEGSRGPQRALQWR
jgi:hypothetical protein